MSNTRAVIGLGNTLRRDDGIGITVLESLLVSYQASGVDYLDFGTVSFDLLHRIRQYETVLLIDGIDAGMQPGEMKIFALKDVAYNAQSTPGSTHALDLKTFFELAKTLEIATKIHVAGIQVQDVSHGEGLSPALAARVSDIVKEISIFISSSL